MIDLSCHACGHAYGYRGEPRDCPPCPRCHVPPERKDMEHDQAIMDEFREFLAEWKDRKTLVKPGRQRMAAGLTLGQAARLLGVHRQSLTDIEAGRIELPSELASKMAAAYGLTADGEGKA